MTSTDVAAAAQRHGIDPVNVPAHVACVMDGNGRWAAERGEPRKAGHKAGEAALYDVVQGSIEVGVKWLTAYAFSTENWSRPEDEVEFLMRFNEDVLEKRSEELHEQGVRLHVAGRRGFPVPDSLSASIDRIAELTKGNTRLNLVIAFNYGGRAEIVDVVRKLIADGVAADAIDEAKIASHLYVPNMPDVDLMVRTSGEFRISNFLLWEVAYGELYFTDTPWPAFDRQELFAAIREYQGRQRRFGGLMGK
jgi:undecaprenyl diphosphate synthase